MNDPGDEDDAAARPDRWLHVALAGVRFMYGRTICIYPAEQLPPLPDHDPGDEQPRLTLDRRLVELLGYVVIELRSRDGKSIRRLPWDGINDTVSFNAAEPAELRHTLWLDTDGKVIVRYDGCHAIQAGDHIEITLHPDRAGANATLLRIDRALTVPVLFDKLGLRSGAGWGPSGLTDLLAKFAARLAGAVGIPYDILYGTDLDLALARDLAPFYGACTRAQVYAMALTVRGVDEVDVSSPEPGHVLVRITRGSDALGREDLDVMRRRLDHVCPAGSVTGVRLDTPQEKLRRAMTSIRADLALGLGWDGVFEATQRAVAKEFGPHGASNVETSISGGGDDPTWMLGVGIEVDGVQYEGRVRIDHLDYRCEPRVATWLTSAKAGEVAMLQLTP